MKTRVTHWLGTREHPTAIPACGGPVRDAGSSDTRAVTCPRCRRVIAERTGAPADAHPDQMVLW